MLWLERVPDSLLRADFEPPDTLVLVYDSAWESSIERAVALAGRRTRVLVLPSEEERVADARAFARRVGATYVPLMVDSPWVRDFAPFQRGPSGRRVWVGYEYSTERPLDNSLPQRLSTLARMPLEVGPGRLDGGAVVSNGAGLCAITDMSLNDTQLDLDQRSERERLLRSLGCSEMAVLPALPREETGHADMVAQFISPDTVLFAQADSTAHPREHAVLEEGARRLQEAGSYLPGGLRIVRVPMEIRDGAHYSYVNGLRLHDAFLVPSYRRVPRRIEALAYARIRGALSVDVETVPIAADEMIERAGAIHCITAGLNLDGRALNIASRFGRRRSSALASAGRERGSHVH